jgi:hypothetical protein
MSRIRLQAVIAGAAGLFLVARRWWWRWRPRRRRRRTGAIHAIRPVYAESQPKPNAHPVPHPANPADPISN